MSEELKAASTVGCPCCKYPIKPRLAFFPGLPTLVFSSQISQSGKDLFPFSCFGFFTPYTTEEPRLQRITWKLWPFVHRDQRKIIHCWWWRGLADGVKCSFSFQSSLQNLSGLRAKAEVPQVPHISCIMDTPQCWADPTEGMSALAGQWSLASGDTKPLFPHRPIKNVPRKQITAHTLHQQEPLPAAVMGPPAKSWAWDHCIKIH